MSEVGCFVLSGIGPSYSAGTEIVLATVTYDIIPSPDGPSTLSFGDSLVADNAGIEYVMCYGPDGQPGGGDDGQCFPALVYVGFSNDIDGDGFGEFDNCPWVHNPGQENNDRNFIDLSPPKSYDDVTRPNSDVLGDACDDDDDNDGLLDVDELTFPMPGCPSASAPTNPLLADTDGDRTLDGAECILGYDPASAASVPPVNVGPDADNDLLPDWLELELGTDPNNPDTDGDGILDGIEFRYYNTNPLLTNTDQHSPLPFSPDICSDGKEIASVNADVQVNIVDLQQIAAHLGSSTSPQYLVNMDINKNGQINVVDLQIAAKQIGPC